MSENIDIKQKNTATTRKKTSPTLGGSFKQRLLLSLLCAFALPFTVFYGVFEIFAANKAEFDFAFADFALPLTLICLGVFALVFAAMIFFRGKVFDLVFAFFFSILVAGWAQGNFLNIGVSSLMGDGVGGEVSSAWVAIDIIIWLAIIAACFLAVILLRKFAEWVNIGAVILMVMIIGMQLASFAVTSVSSDVYAPVSNEDASYILTEKNIYEVSSKKNVIVFVLDRFDNEYAELVMENEPEFFDKLDGFTYYEDNMSLHMRTYPAAVSLITGIDTDFSMDAPDYFHHAYQTSPFLHTLKNNDYKINIFVDGFYGYRDAKAFEGIADNVYKTGSEYTVNRPWTLTGRLIALSTYRYVPVAAKSLYMLSSGSFSGFVEYATPEAKYEPDDAVLYQKLKDEGVSVQDEKNTFSYIHLSGCHPPYYIDEDGSDPGNEWRESHEWAARAMKGCFRLIYDYIDGLKACGAYEDATIIITGDHPNPVNDYILLDEPRLVALFVKRAGESETEFTKSSLPVSQVQFIPSIVESAGLVSDREWGVSYWTEGGTGPRIYRHILNHSAPECDVVEYKVTGSGRDFENWEIISETPIGDLYE